MLMTVFHRLARRECADLHKHTLKRLVADERGQLLQSSRGQLLVLQLTHELLRPLEIRGHDLGCEVKRLSHQILEPGPKMREEFYRLCPRGRKCF